MIRFKRPFRDRAPTLLAVLSADALAVLWLGVEVWPYALTAAVLGTLFVLVDLDAFE